jgi:hypothetical protein
MASRKRPYKPRKELPGCSGPSIGTRGCRKAAKSGDIPDIPDIPDMVNVIEIENSGCNDNEGVGENGSTIFIA